MDRVDDLEGKGRHYFHPVTEHAMPSVTNVNAILPKPWLLKWAVTEERKLVLEAASAVYASLNGEKVSPIEFRKRMAMAVPTKRAHETIRDDAAELGTAAHAFIEWRILGDLGLPRGPEPKLPKSAELGVIAWEKWAKSVNFQPAYSEKRLYSDELDSAGTTDAIIGAMDVFMLAMTPRRIKVLADWKLTKRIDRSAEVQVAVLRHMAIERGLLDEKAWGLVLRLPKTTRETEAEERYIQPSRCRELVEVFRAARLIWKWANVDKETPK